MSELLRVSSPSLGRLEPGEYSLGAPDHDGIIQIKTGPAGQFGKTRIVLTKEEYAVNITREDDLPLQVLAARDKKATIVFEEPVPSIDMTTPERGYRSGNIWTLGNEGLVIPNQVGFQDFVGIVASHALDKQNREWIAHVLG